jgi:hypothetical protein
MSDTSAEAVERMIDLLRLPFGAASVFRDLLAERDRMREALRKVRDELGGSGQTHASLLRAFNIAYTALNKGMGHE